MENVSVGPEAPETPSLYVQFESFATPMVLREEEEESGGRLSMRPRTLTNERASNKMPPPATVSLLSQIVGRDPLAEYR